MPNTKPLRIPPLVAQCAPAQDIHIDYDRTHMMTYARLLDAERDGYHWSAAAAEILLLDVDADRDAAERCWRSHLDRARWIVGEGLAVAIMAD